MTKIAILGRGKSLKYYPEFSNLFNRVYLVNNFSKELNYLGFKYFENKKILHVVGRGPNSLTKQQYKMLNILSVQCSCFDKTQFSSRLGKSYCYKYEKLKRKVKVLPVALLKRGYPPVPMSIIADNISKYDNYKDLCYFIEKKYHKKIKVFRNKNFRIWPTTGVLAIELALLRKGIKEIFLFGFDGYLSKYLLKNLVRKNNDPNRPVALVLRYHLSQLVKEFPNILFKTSSKLVQIKSENWSYL